MFNVDDKTEDAENDGVWTEYQGSKFLIAANGSMLFQRVFSKLQLPHQKAIRRNNLDPTIQLDIMAKAMSRGLLLDWTDVVDKSGSPVKFSSDAAYATLKGNSQFREFVTDFAVDIGNYKEDEKEELGKPVEKSSTGKSNLAQGKSS